MLVFAVRGGVEPSSDGSFGFTTTFDKLLIFNGKLEIESGNLFTLSLGRGQGEGSTRRGILSHPSPEFLSSYVAKKFYPLPQGARGYERHSEALAEESKFFVANAFIPCERSEQNNLLSYLLIHLSTFFKGGALC